MPAAAVAEPGAVEGAAQSETPSFGLGPVFDAMPAAAVAEAHGVDRHAGVGLGDGVDRRHRQRRVVPAVCAAHA